LSLIRDWRTPLTLLAILAAAFYVYLPVIHMDYVWDDFFLFVNDPKLRSGQINWQALAAPLMPTTTYFRPAVLMSFMLEFRYFGVDSEVSHRINLAFFLANIALLFAITHRLSTLYKLTKPLLCAALAAAAYSIHPTLIESTAWISGRFDVLATFAVLLGVFFFLFVRNTWLQLLLLCIAYALGLGAKEVAIVFPAILLCLQLTLPNNKEATAPAAALHILRAHRTLYISLFAILLGYIALKGYTIGRVLHSDQKMQLLLDGKPIDHILLCLQTLFFYLKMTLLPFASISPQHPLDVDALRAPVGILQAITAAVFFVVIAWGAWYRNRQSLLILIGIGCLVPVLHIIPLTTAGNIGMERFLTLPMAFFCMSLGTALPLIDRLNSKRLIYALLLIWLTFGFLTTKTTVPMWQKDLSLWQWAYLKSPDNVYIQRSYLAALLREGRYDLAKPIFEKQLQEGPLNRFNQLMYGNYLAKTGDLKEARAYLEGALAAYMPAHEMPDGYQANQDSELAIARWEQGFGRTAIAEVYLKEGLYAEANRAADAALWYMPNYSPILFTKATTLFSLGDTQQAEMYFGLALHNAHPRAKNDLINNWASFVSFFCSQTKNTGCSEAGGKN
jgi:protein O-mannosyl-transferase